MARFRVLVGWTMRAWVEIEAGSEDEAERQAYDADQLPHTDAEYVDGTFQVAEIKRLQAQGETR